MKKTLIFILMISLPGPLHALEFSDLVPDVFGSMIMPREDPSPGNCYQEVVQSFGSDLVIEEGNCKRVICEGNFWGKSCTDICLSGEEVEVGEGEEQIIFENGQARSCTDTLSTDPWHPIRLPSSRSVPDSSARKRESPKDTIYSKFPDILVHDAMAAYTVSDESPISDIDRQNLAQRIESGIQNMIQYASEENVEFAGEAGTEYRSYFFYSLQSAIVALHFLLPNEYACPENLRSFCDSVGNIEIVWANIGGAYGVTSGIRKISMDRDYLLPGYATFFAAIFVHEVTHAINLGTDRFGYIDPTTGGSLSVGSFPTGEGWQHYHNESSARACGNIFYVMLPDAYRSDMDIRLRSIGDALFGGGWINLKADPRLARRYLPPGYFFTAVFQIDFEWAQKLPILIDAYRELHPDRATDRYAAVAEAVYDWYFSDISPEDEIVVARHLFRRWGELYLELYEARFQDAGGVFRLWPACTEYVGIETDMTVLELCMGDGFLADPDLQNDEFEGSSPETDEEEGESPSEDEVEEAPEREDQEGSTGSEPLMPAGCLDHLNGVSPGDGGPSLRECSDACFELVADGFDSRRGICTRLTQLGCSGPSPGPECASRCVDERDDFCFNRCEADPSLPWCGDLCPAGSRDNSRCRSLCEAHDNYGFCGSLCASNPELSWCEDRCDRGLGRTSYCPDICEANSRHEFCTDLCADLDEPWCRDICNASEPPPAFCSRYETSSSVGGDSSGGEEDPIDEFVCPTSWVSDDQELLTGFELDLFSLVDEGDFAGDIERWMLAVLEAQMSNNCNIYIGPVRCCEKHGQNFCFPSGSNLACRAGGYCGCSNLSDFETNYLGSCTHPDSGITTVFCCYNDLGCYCDNYAAFAPFTMCDYEPANTELLP